MKTSLVLRSLGSAENRSLRAARSSSPVVSSVPSRPDFSSLIRAALMSKPMVRYFLPNSTAKGKPTYPRPMTAILCLLNPRIGALLNAMDCQQRHCQVVDDGCDGLPNRQRSHALGVERHDDRVARLDFRRLRAPEPAVSLPRTHVAICAHDIYSLAVRLLRGPAAPRDVFIAADSRFIHVRGGTLHFTQDRDLLGLLRNQQLVAVSDHDVVGHARGSLDHPSDIYDETADRLRIAKLTHQLLADGQRLNGAAAGCARVGGAAADRRLQRQGREIAL